MLLGDLINVGKLRRAILYAACVLAALILQNALLCRLTILGVKPMIVPVIIVAIGLFENGLWGGLFGLAAGLLCDSSSLGPAVLFTVVFTVEGFLTGLLAQLYINRRLYSYMILSLLALAAMALCQLLPLWIYSGSALLPLLRTAGLQTLWSLPFGVPAYFACRAIAGRKTDR